MISNRTVTVQLSEPVYRRLQRIAEITHRALEDVLATSINVALPSDPELPADLAADLAAMPMLSDEALWAASESSLTSSQQRRLAQLAHAGGARRLTTAEMAELDHLQELYDRTVLRRARALAVLAFRGYAIPDRTDLPDPGRIIYA